MITVSKIKNCGAALQYYSERDDYYREGGGAPAAFYGRGAEQLGLSGAMETRRDAVRFADVLSGKATGKETRHTPGYDVTFSAPKSVSVAGLVYGDRRLIDAHDRAVRAALAHIERHAIVTRQRGADGSGYEWRHGAGMVAALFRHSTSREQDCQLHSHAVIANTTRDPATGAWRAIDSREIYRIQREASAIHASEFAADARALGYEVSWKINAEGHIEWGVEGIPAELVALHSKRSAQVEAALEARGLDRAAASPDAKQAAALTTRADKSVIDHGILAARWRDEARALGYDPDRAPPIPAWPDPAARREAAEAAVRQAAEHLSERDARFSARSLEHEARLFAQGRADGAEIRAAVIELTRRGELEQRAVQVRAAGGRREPGAGFTTRTGIETERRMLQSAQRLADRRAYLGPADATRGHRDRLAADAIRHQEARGGRAFSQEQRAATAAILTSGRALHVLHGHAGTAKTSSVLAAVRHEAVAHHFKVRALAPTTKAAEKLGGSLLLKGATVASHLTDHSAPQRGPRPQRELWVVDEAGMISAKDMRALLEKADREQATVILAGDTQQLGSVEAGAAFEQIRDRHGSVDLIDIKRQKNEVLRSAVYDAVRGDARAALDKVPVTEMKTREQRVAEVARLYMAHSADERRETVVLAPGKDDRSQINAAIREARKDRGELGRETEITALVKSDMTRAEQRDAARYQPGMVIEAGRRFMHGPQKGERCEVTGVEKGRVVTRMTDGRAWSFDPRKTSSFSIYDEARTLRVAEGDRLIARGAIEAEGADGKAARIQNGTALEVVRVTDSGVVVRDDQRQLFEISRDAQVDYGYAQTVHQAQGQDYARVIAHAESSRENLASLSSMYVTLSRARDSATVVTDSQDKLAATLEANAGRKSTALETAHEPHEPAPYQLGQLAEHQQHQHQQQPEQHPEQHPEQRPQIDGAQSELEPEIDRDQLERDIAAGWAQFERGLELDPEVEAGIARGAEQLGLDTDAPDFDPEQDPEQEIDGPQWG